MSSIEIVDAQIINFAKAMHLSDDTFISEVRHNVKMMTGHASLIMFPRIHMQTLRYINIYKKYVTSYPAKFPNHVILATGFDDGDLYYFTARCS